MIDFDTYIKMGEPGGKERAEAWKTAIGLQAVVRMLYPDSPHHPRQKYLLTVKGLAAYKELSR